MQELDPNDIPNFISLIATLYGKSKTTEEEDKSISKFFMTYMGKAIEDCQDKTLSHHVFPRHSGDISPNFKVVDIDASNTNGKVQFIVGTAATPLHNRDNNKAIVMLQSTFSELFLKEYKNPEDGSWVMVFNKLLFGKSKANKFATALVIAVRFSKEHFEPLESADDETKEASKEI